MSARRVSSGLAAALAAAVASPALAAPLVSVWHLVDATPTGERPARVGEIVLEQRIVPLRAVTLTEDASGEGGKVTRAGTPLFLVAQADGKTAFCTIKDRSAGNAAKSLFIPALDKRPCFVDRDGDGRFDAGFSVFEKYGSALTPSGNLDKAVPLAGGGGYAALAPEAFPSPFRLTYRLVGKLDPAKLRIEVAFDNGSGKPEVGVARTERTPGGVKAMNVTVTLASAAAGAPRVTVATEPGGYLLGASGGGFALVPTLPAFLDD